MISMMQLIWNRKWYGLCPTFCVLTSKPGRTWNPEVLSFFNSRCPIKAPQSNMAASVLVQVTEIYCNLCYCSLDSRISKSYRYSHLFLFALYQFQRLRCLKCQVQVVIILKVRRRMFDVESCASVCCYTHRQWTGWHGQAPQKLCRHWWRD